MFKQPVYATARDHLQAMYELKSQINSFNDKANGLERRAIDIMEAWKARKYDARVDVGTYYRCHEFGEAPYAWLGECANELDGYITLLCDLQQKYRSIVQVMDDHREDYHQMMAVKNGLKPEE